MDPNVSHVVEQTECIYLAVDEDAEIRSILAEAKDLATREGKMVMFAITTSSRFLQVTSESNIERMIDEYFDRYYCRLIITSPA